MITDPETLFLRLDATQKTVAIALQRQATALDSFARNQSSAGNLHGAKRCAQDAEAVRERLEDLLLTAWHPASSASASNWVQPC